MEGGWGPRAAKENANQLPTMHIKRCLGHVCGHSPRKTIPPHDENWFQSFDHKNSSRPFQLERAFQPLFGAWAASGETPCRKSTSGQSRHATRVVETTRCLLAELVVLERPMERPLLLQKGMKKTFVGEKGVWKTERIFIPPPPPPLCPKKQTKKNPRKKMNLMLLFFAIFQK